jgi:hypothetical protein
LKRGYSRSVFWYILLLQWIGSWRGLTSILGISSADCRKAGAKLEEQWKYVENPVLEFVRKIEVFPLASWPFSPPPLPGLRRKSRVDPSLE